ncbi:MAG: error-prone DNA polymerase [Rhodospirillum sp.]|nr:error-prone DNA polymerase [Rhodospirillum sp.]MCF8488991.1 error-prone DNA polymerase [Rhodospirillum sp.]
MSPPPPAYAELFAQTNYSFLEAASHPDELVLTAGALGLSALAVTDRNSLAGVVRAHVAAKRTGLPLVIGALLSPLPGQGPELLCHPEDRAAYGRLSRLLTIGRRAAPKGECHLNRTDIEAQAEGQWLTILPPENLADPGADGTFVDHLRQWKAVAGPRLSLGLRPRLDGTDARRLWRLARLAEAEGIAPVALGGARMHTPQRKPLLDVLTCLRHHVTIETAGLLLAPNDEAHLRAPAAMATLMAAHPRALARSVEVATACRFSLDELRYEYPDTDLAPGEIPQDRLARLTAVGAARRYPEGVPDAIQARVDRELTIIGRLGYAPYFLTVHDIVAQARTWGILCQGRGSAANSAVCYCLGITAVDPERVDLLFERFISAARDEPPDIDVDFEHERREEIIQYIYRKYGRDRAGLAATVITWRARSALREVGKVMGLSQDATAALAATVWGSSSHVPEADRIRESGLDPTEPRLALTLRLAEALVGFPRHLSQHVGGFVLTRGPLSEVVPIENAAMANRTVIQWDKDDLDALGILKIDVLALGMLSCIRKALDLVAHHHHHPLTLATVPDKDEATYDMLCRGDSLGVFQVESRAQMSMLPRLQPRTYYDLVIEVAIVRPGPIQGDMVHPYLRRRRGEEQVDYPSETLRRVLEKTLGVPLFQEQAMRIAIEGAGFTAEEADGLRRSMAAFRRTGALGPYREKFLAGMAANGYTLAFAERCFRQIEGFGDYGFPESHAASFALLVYVSAWLKRHYPAAFACALLNSQPMGFYSPAQIVRDAREHGVEVRPVDINTSDWDNLLEVFQRPGGKRGVALRLGFRQIMGFPETAARAIVTARGAGYADPHAVWRRAGVEAPLLDKLTQADAFTSLGLERRGALWAVKALKAQPLPLFEAAEKRQVDLPNGPDLLVEPEPFFRDLTPGEALTEDYAALRLSLRAHPLGLLRGRLTQAGAQPCRKLEILPDGAWVTIAGLAVCRQRPGSASGVVFITLEDEEAIANLVVWPKVFEEHRRAIMGGRLLMVTGRVQKDGLVIHLVVEALSNLTGLLAALTPEDHPRETVARVMETARADRVRHNRPVVLGKATP